MNMLIRLLIAVAAVSMLLLPGCGERTNPADPTAPDSGLKPVLQYARTFGADQLPDLSWVNYRSRVIRIYTPPKYPIPFSGDGTKYPTLYLLHDLNENETSFLKARIDLIADQLIASGEIQPMIIVMPDLSTVSGGSFYSDSWNMYNPLASIPAPGNFESAVGEDLIRFMEADAYNPPDTLAFNIITKRASRAIGGVGMGGYGALRIAMKYPNLFSSVSVMNGLVSLGTTGDPGILDFVDEVFEENGIAKGDQDGYYAIDTAYNKPYTALILSAAAAFSPHDPESEPSETLLERFQVDLPFDYNGDLVPGVVERWKSHDLIDDESDFELFNLLGSLDSTEVYVDYSTEDQFNTAGQSQALIELLEDLGYDPEVRTFGGHGSLPARHNVYNYDRIAEMLKFHSRHLSSDPEL